MIRLKSIALLSILCLVVAVFAGCYKHAELTIEVGEQGPFKPRFVGNDRMLSLYLMHVYGWPEDTPSDDTPDGEPIRRYDLIWSVLFSGRSQSKLRASIQYGQVPLGYEGEEAASLELGELYRVESQMLEVGPPPGNRAVDYFCILEDESGKPHLIRLTLRGDDSGQPFNEVSLELEEGTGKILKIIPVESEKG